MSTSFSLSSSLTRRALVSSGCVLLSAFAAGCAAPAPSKPAASVQGPPGMPALAVIPSTDLAVGRNRFALGLLDADNKPVPDATVHLRFYQLDSQFRALSATPKAEADATFRYVDLKTRGLYIAQVTFDAPGPWGVEVTGTKDGKPFAPVRAPFQVAEKSHTPAIGQPVPPSRHPLAKDVANLAEICSNVPPCDMHTITIADALTLGKPLVALFATPGYCVSQTCAPQLGVVQELKRRYGEQASFVHIEIYTDPKNRVVAKPVEEWGLTSEPWTFLVDRTGLLAEKFEGGAPVDELEEALRKLL
jgi:hypothetical protein